MEKVSRDGHENECNHIKEEAASVQRSTTKVTSKHSENAEGSRDMAESLRSMNIARERSVNLGQILTHDLLSASPLFDRRSYSLC